MAVCPQCGSENPDDANFCSVCGTRLRPAAAEALSEGTSTVTLGRDEAERVEETPGLTMDDQAAVEALPSGSALLLVLRGPNAGSRFLLDTDVVTAGRHPDSDIFLDDITVSRRHAELRRTSEGYVVRDVGSLNGTYVNRDRIDSVLLNNGDEVQIGKFRLVYYASQRGFGGVPQ
jgi:pSer/pThr/pTyr-binding forkhead associated (FHA) protein